MPCPENLTNMTPEERFAASSKGGKRSAETRKAKKKMAEELTLLLALPIRKKTIGNKATKIIEADTAKALEEFKGMNTTVQTQILLKITQMAMTGNIKAVEFIANVTGESKQAIDINMNAKVNSPVDTLADDLFGDDKK